MFRIALAAVLALLLATPTAADDATTAAEVLAHFIDAVGGRDALETCAVRHYRGTIVQDLGWKEPRHSEWTFLAEADTAGAVRYAEVATWAELPAVDDGEPRRKLRWIFHPHFALVVEKFFPDLEFTGEETRNGRRVRVLAPRGMEIEHYALYFDGETGLLSHVGYHNDLQGWREVDGVLFPHRWVFGRKGGHTTYVFEEVCTGYAPEN